MSAIPITKANHACSVCGKPAFVECLLYDVYLDVPDIFLERDFTCPFLCETHFRENEEKAFSQVENDKLDVTMRQIAEQFRSGTRRMDFAITQSGAGGGGPMFQSAAEIIKDSFEKIPALRDYRGSVHYPYTNRESAQGFTIYRKLE